MIQYYRLQYKVLVLLIGITFSCINYSMSQDSLSIKEAKFSSLAFGTDYTSNYNLNGRVSNIKSQPVFSTLVSFYHKWGIDASLSASNIWNSDETNSASSQEIDLSLSYDYDFTKWLNTTVSYNHFFYSKNAYSIQSDYKDLLSLSVYTEVDWWVTNAMLGYYSGQANELFVNIETGIDFTFDDVLKKGNMLSIQPMLSVFAGDMDFYSTDAYRDYFFLYTYSQKYPDASVEEMMVQLQQPTTNFEKRLSQRLEDKPWLVNRIKDLPSELKISTLFEEKHSFTLSSIGFTLPIFYSWEDFMINASVSAYKPINMPSYLDDSWTVYTNVGVSYFIAW